MSKEATAVLVLIVVACFAIAGLFVFHDHLATQATVEHYDEQTRAAHARQQEAEDQLANAAAQARAQPAVNYAGWLKDGEQQAWSVPPGTYQVRMTASGGGATLAWVGASCGEARTETTQFDTTCFVQAPAQLVIRNPCDVCVGDSVSVALTVNRR